MGEVLAVEAGLALVGESLQPRRGVCVWIREGLIESIEGSHTCPPERLGGGEYVLLPQPANAHVHSADFAFPEYGIDLSLEEAVAPPHGLKHRLLEATPPEKLYAAIRSFYKLAFRVGIGLLADFREGGGRGCAIARRAWESVGQGMDLLLLGRPGPGWPGECDGLGLSSPLDYSLEELSKLASQARPAGAHVAETRGAREADDLERALEAGLDFLVHGVYLTREDLAEMASRGVSLIVCPRSNAWHALGTPPLPEAWAEGVVVGIGTDNAGWFLPDIWEEARALAFAALLRGARRGPLARLVLESLFVGGYRALRRQPRLIAEGQRAHFLLANSSGRGILEARDVFWAVLKRVDVSSVEYRVDGSRVTRL